MCHCVGRWQWTACFKDLRLLVDPVDQSTVLGIIVVSGGALGEEALGEAGHMGPHDAVGCMHSVDTRRREVDRQQPMGWRLFTSSSGWLCRFTKRFKIVIRRKTNAKRETIEKRVPKLKRWFATKRLFLLSKKGKRCYCDKT